MFFKTFEISFAADAGRGVESKQTLYCAWTGSQVSGPRWDAHDAVAHTAQRQQQAAPPAFL